MISRRASFLRLCVGVMLVGVVTASALVAPAGAQNGVVRIHNSTPVPVTILSMQIETFGRREWRPIGNIPPGRTQDFPGVPAGAVFGAQAANRSKQWPPFTIVYPYGPIFEYRLSW